MRIVVGVDSSGSRTRALAASLAGERVAYAETGGGHRRHDAAADDNLREAIRRVSEGREIVRLVAGVAGLNEPADEARIADALREVPGTKRFVNDAAVAHFAAFADGPGIVSIQGTGSTIRAVLEDGRAVCNGDFMHYARSGAVWVGIRAVHKLLRDPTASRESALREAAFAAWGVDSVETLRQALARQAELSPFERSRRYGTIARGVTASAEAGGVFSQWVCSVAAREVVDGILILGPMFAEDEVPVAFVGACVRSPAILRGVVRRLSTDRAKRYRVVEAEVPPVVGAVRMALREEGIEIDGEPGRWLAPPH